MLLETPICDFGWKPPSFTLKDALGSEYTLENLYGTNGLLIVFMCNHCPYVKAIIDRLVDDAGVLRDEGINVIGINANDYMQYPNDSPENMIKFAQTHKIDFPYLIDETQDVAKAFGAVCTPDFFGFNNKGELQYRGRIDNAKMNDPKDRIPELIYAMRMIAETGKGPEEQFPSMGCSIKWKNQ